MLTFPYPSALTTAKIRQRVRARAIAMVVSIPSEIVCSESGWRSTGLGWHMPSMPVTAAFLDRA
jgi:hypothetical protein